MLMSTAGGSADLNSVTLTFDDAGAALTTNTITSGTYRPTDLKGTNVLADPAPARPYSKTLSDFTNSPPNGVWSLYAYDHATNDLGSIAGGWTLRIATATLVPPVIQTPKLTPGLGEFVMDVPAEMNHAYWLEMRTNLWEGNWKVIQGFTNLPGLLRFRDYAATNQSRFYRIGGTFAP